jgi:DNA-directed RNA polymerase subunit alpha
MNYSLHIPVINTTTEDGHTATFVIEPLNKGFGITLGNSLRRVLLSSLEGGAVTGFSVAGAAHEFSTLPGVVEDLVQITLNLKKLRFRVYSDEPQELRLTKKGKGTLTAADIERNVEVEIINPKQHIATLDSSKASLEMTLKVEKGRGYWPIEERGERSGEVGLIAIDTLFSPIERVRYTIARTRVGQVTDLDKLTLEITTDGSISPLEALRQSAAILSEQFSILTGEERSSTTEQAEPDNESGTEPAELNFGIEDLGLSQRTTNALTNNKISTVRDLIELSDNDLKNLKGFGSKANQEVLDKLRELELR